LKGRTLRLADGRTLGELKAEGGYVLVPPSRIAGLPYQLLSPLEVEPLVVAKPMEWLGELLAAFDYQLATSEGPSREYLKLGGTIFEGEGRHNALKSYAGRIWVQGISDEGFIGALEAVNTAQCKPPLPAGELQAIARWYIEGKDRGSVGGREQASEAMWESLGARKPPPASGANDDRGAGAGAARQPLPLPDGHFVLRYARYAASRTDAPVSYHEALAVAQLSAAVGRSIRIPLASKPDGMFCNIWLLLLGDSTLYRKSTSEDLAVDLLRNVDPAMFLANDQSPQGFIEEMSFRDGLPAVWHRDEFRSFLAQLKHASWMAGGKELLMKFFDGSSYFRRLRTKKVKGQEFPDEAKVDAPYLVVIAAGVTERILTVLSVDDVIDGFLPRFLIVAPKTRPRRRRPATITAAIERERRELIEALRRLHDGFRERRDCSVQFDEDAWERWNEYAEHIEAEAADSATSDLFGPIAGRIADTVLKVAALFVAAEGVPARGTSLRISRVALEAAIVFCEQFRREAEELAMNVGSSVNERRLVKLVEMVKQKPGISRTVIARSLKLDKREMDNLEDTAFDRNLIMCVTKETGGRPAKGYWFVGEDDATSVA
jgi:hypothetical protein